MAFFDDLGKRLSDAGQELLQKARPVTDEDRLYDAIADAESQIGALYEELGKTYYETWCEAHKEGDASEVPETIASIQKLFKDIEQYEQEIEQLHAVVRCPKCGAEMPPDFSFCTVCGSALVPAAKPAAVCPSCGAEVPEGSAFCSKCGAKLG